MSYSDIVDKVSKDVNLPKEIVDKTYKSYWSLIKDHIQSLPLKKNLSEEELAKLKTNFNIPSLGKLNCNIEKLLKIRNKQELIKQLKGEDAKS